MLLQQQKSFLLNLTKVPDAVIIQSFSKFNLDLAKVFTEICFNLLYSDLGLTEAEKLKLKPFKTQIRTLSEQNFQRNFKILKNNPNLVKILVETIEPVLNG